MDPAPGGEVVSLAERRQRGGIVAFLSRPQLAIAATFVLVLGATAVFLGSSSAKREAPAMAAAEPALEGPRDDQARVAATEAASAMAYATPPPAAAPTPAGPANEWDEALGGLDSPSQKAVSGGGASARGHAEAKAHDPAFAAAKALFDAGRYTDALPKFEALAPTHPEAELYAARCIANTKGCGPAIARYETAAQRNVGRESGSRAALEAARCMTRTGQVTAARSRYETLTNDSHVAHEANAELAALAPPKAAAKAAKPAAPPATATAAPKAAPPKSQPNAL